MKNWLHMFRGRLLFGAVLIAAAALRGGESAGLESGDWVVEALAASEAAGEVPLQPAPMDEGARLESLPPISIPVQDAPLHAAISLVASAAGMSYIAPDPGLFAEPVTLSARVNPWRLLKLLSERHGFSMRVQDGVWVFDREARTKLVSRTYLLRHANLDSYASSQNAFNLLDASGGGAETAGAGGLVFTPKTDKILADLKVLVGVSPDGGEVLYLPDANSLYVTTTETRHERVLEYLRIVDQPVSQIRIEARFYETTHDPRSVLGLDPAGYQPNIKMDQLQTVFDLNRPGGLRLPEKVLLGAEALSFQIRALQTDDRSRLVNNPTVVVANNREAYFSVGDEEPFVSSNSVNNGAADGGFGTTQAHVAIRRIGTSINLVPTIFSGAEGEAPRIRLSIRMEVGVLKGFRQLNSVSVPVVSSQKYEYTVFLREGETLAFGGLCGSVESESVHKVPLAGDIPLLGGAFRSRNRQATQRNLVAYLSASVVKEGAAPPAPPELEVFR